MLEYLCDFCNNLFFKYFWRTWLACFLRIFLIYCFFSFIRFLNIWLMHIFIAFLVLSTESGQKMFCSTKAKKKIIHFLFLSLRHFSSFESELNFHKNISIRFDFLTSLTCWTPSVGWCCDVWPWWCDDDFLKANVTLSLPKFASNSWEMFIKGGLPVAFWMT